MVIYTFTGDSVNFSISVWAYKYRLENLKLPKQLYYIFADRLNANIRFVHDWFALETPLRQLEMAMRRGKLLPQIQVDLQHELSLLRTPTSTQVQASCRSLFPLLEQAMRKYIEFGSTAIRAGTLDDLIRKFESKRVVSQDTIELLRFVIKPKRDYIEHGRSLPEPIARLVLVTLLNVLCSFGEIDA